MKQRQSAAQIRLLPHLSLPGEDGEVLPTLLSPASPSCLYGNLCGLCGTDSVRKKVLGVRVSFSQAVRALGSGEL